MILAFTHGIYLPLTILAIGCCMVFALRLGVPMLKRQTPLAGNYLAVSVIGFTFTLGFETPLYWLVRTVPDLQWVAQVPLIFVAPKAIALIASVFAAAGLSHALTGNSRLGWFAVGAAVLWAVGGAASMIVRALNPMTTIGDPIYKGSPALPGVYCVRVRFSSGETFAKYDGTRFARAHPTIAQAKAEELDHQGRVQQTRVMRREDIEYWRTIEDDSDTKPTEQTKKTSFFALWRAAVDRLLGRA